MDFTPEDWRKTSCGYVVLDIPFLLPEHLGGLGSHPKIKRRLVPALAVTDGIKDDLPLSVLRWSRDGINRRTLDAQRAGVAALGRLYDFRMLFPQFQIEDHHDVDLLIWSYLFARLTVPPDVDERLIPVWERVALSTAMTEFSMFREFAKFSSSDKDSLFGRALRIDSRLFATMPAKIPDGHFFGHLRAQYARFVSLTGSEVGFPADLKYLSKRRARKPKKAIYQLTPEEVDAIIDGEKNLMLKSLWILLIFVGSRISEALHLWICDILPGGYSKYFGDFETEFPLVVFAHPKESSYVGNLGGPAANDNREQFLDERYGGRQPRTDADYDVGEGAGWKSILFFDEARALAWGTWIDPDRANQFATLVGAVQAIHRRTGSAKASPYFFVNSAPGEFCGLPMKMGNIEKAFQRACTRAGVGRPGRRPSLHSMRHYYAWYARNVLKMKKEEIQFMMRHKSMNSNEEYGQRASQLQTNVSSRFERRAA